MGQKAHPYGLRLGYIRPWKSRWYSRKDYTRLLHEDLKIRDFIKEKWNFAGISNVEIERSGKKLRLTIHTARPGVIIGRRGSEIDKLRDEIGALTTNEVYIDIKEIKTPQTDAQLVAENIAQQLVKRVSFRKAMKKSVQLAMSKGALGIKVLCAGRLGGAEIARTDGYKEGKVPLGTFRADIDYGFAEAFTTYGCIGIKIWIYKGDVLVKKEQAQKVKEREQQAMEADADAGVKVAEESPAPAHESESQSSGGTKQSDESSNENAPDKPADSGQGES